MRLMRDRGWLSRSRFPRPGGLPSVPSCVQEVQILPPHNNKAAGWKHLADQGETLVPVYFLSRLGLRPDCFAWEWNDLVCVTTAFDSGLGSAPIPTILPQEAGIGPQLTFSERATLAAFFARCSDLNMSANAEVLIRVGIAGHKAKSLAFSDSFDVNKDKSSLLRQAMAITGEKVLKAMVKYIIVTA